MIVFVNYIVKNVKIVDLINYYNFFLKIVIYRFKS